jgi:teichuronic acid biosynthesis glycosyltransferase TuaC
MDLHTHVHRREYTRAHAETFSWDATTQGQLRLFTRVINPAKGTA